MQEKNRSEIDNKYKWDLSKIYQDPDLLEKDKQEILKLKDQLVAMRGSLTANATNLLKAIDLYYAIMRILDKMVVYTNMKFHEDMDNNASKVLVGKVDKLASEISADLSFFTPEVLKCDYQEITKFLSENQELKKYQHMLEDLYREKKYVLDEKEEKLLSTLQEAFQVPSNVFDLLNDVDMTFEDIKDEEGNIISVTESNYSSLVKSSSRRVRHDAYYSLYNGYKKLKNTFSATLAGNVKVDSLIAKIRGYDSVLQMSLYGDNIDLSLYDHLLKAVNSSKVMDKYLALRKEVLGLDELHMYDMYAPLVKEYNKKYTYEEAKEMVLEALKPLGEDYLTHLKELFDEGAIDVFPNKNKRSGAYSWGSYDTMPYVLLNFVGTFSDVSTIAHECGHAMHSYYSDHNQEYHNASYTIFLAEIASTVNEILLNHYALNKATKKEEKLFFLNNLLELYRTTFIRQAMFAEFEKEIYAKEQNGEILTEEVFTSCYKDLNDKYYKGVVDDDLIRYEAFRIPHFYTSFYVYKYATGIAVSSKIATSILNNESNALENYLTFLKSGSSDYSLNILKKVGIDLVNDTTLDDILKEFDKLIEEFKEIYRS